jgi:adenylate kinase
VAVDFPLNHAFHSGDQPDMRLVFIGPPGSGKGTLSKRLVEHLGVPHLSTGEMLRSAIAEARAEGVIAERYMSQGQLAPDDLVMQIVERRLAEPDCAHGCLFDGFPRTIPQAQGLDRILEKAGTPLDLALELKVDRQELERRMQQRAKVERRDDDTPETIARRIDVYARQTEPLVQYYSERGRLVPINAMQSPDAVLAEAQRAIESRCRSGVASPRQDFP